jgi:hypothetical protein
MFARILALEAKINSITTAAPDWELTSGLEVHVSIYHTVAASTNNHKDQHWQQHCSHHAIKQVVRLQGRGSCKPCSCKLSLTSNACLLACFTEYPEKKNHFDMLQGNENDTAKWKKVLSFVQDSFTERCSAWKKIVSEALCSPVPPASPLNMYF